jgi:2-dehydro-3-deoxygalactonokinase
MVDREPVLFCVDMGTTRTRVWITEGPRVWTSVAGDAGVRDVAAGQSREWLADRLHELMETAATKGAERGLANRPTAILAAGMITSPQGLFDVPHLDAPAGVNDLARHLHVETFPLAAGRPLPLLLFPGVRCGASTGGIAATLETDLMRGEETLCLGLLEQNRLTAGTVLLNLGSHWKLIWSDAQKRIAGSRTSLTGEMIHVLQTNTLLASSVAQQPPHALDEEWAQYGYDEAARSGISRALFCVRLLHLSGQGTEDQRLSFLYGSVLQNDFAHLATHWKDRRHERLLVTGAAPLAGICRLYAERSGIPATVLVEEDREQAYLLGLRCLYRSHRDNRG